MNWLSFALLPPSLLVGLLGGGCDVMGVIGNNGPVAPDDQVCVPHERDCDGNAVIMCSDTGSAWELANECAQGCSAGLCMTECSPDCSEKDCGDDGCAGSCGTCTGSQQLCLDGLCTCQPDCAGKDCGDDGCGASCGPCDLNDHTCSDQQVCLPCQSTVCGVCDEIDISDIVAYGGPIGGDHANDSLRAEVLADWPITTDLEITFNSSSAGFILHHSDGESWSTTSNGYADGAVMVACWHSINHGGIFCQSWEWYTPDVGGIYRSFDWPVDRPVAHVLISAIDHKRTAIKYFGSWPYNNVPSHFDGGNVGPNLAKQPCQ